jgi:Protein-L-isoaspartate carboxylmethyltransferase
MLSFVGAMAGKAGLPWRLTTASSSPRQRPRSRRRCWTNWAPGGRLVIPVGGGEVQQLMLIVRTEDGFQRQVLDSVRFVPLLNGPLG